MTDTLASLYPDQVHQTEAAKKRRKARRAVEARFRMYGLLAIGLAVLALGVLLGSMVGSGVTAFWQHSVEVEVTLDESDIDPTGAREDRTLLRYNYNGLFRDWLREQFPTVTGRREKLQMYGLLSSGAPVELREKVMENPDLIGETITIDAPLSDDMDVYMKGKITKVAETAKDVPLTLTIDEERSVAISAQSDVFEDAYQGVKEYYRDQAAEHQEKADTLRSRSDDIERDIDGWIKAINLYAKSMTDEPLGRRLINDSFNWEARLDRIVENIVSYYSAPVTEDAEALELSDGSEVWTALIQSVAKRLPEYAEADTVHGTDENGEETDGPRLPTARELENLIGDLDRLLKNVSDLETQAVADRARSEDMSLEEELTNKMPSYLIEANDGVIKLKTILPDSAEGLVDLPLSSTATPSSWNLVTLITPESERRLNDQEIVWMQHLENRGLVKKEWNRRLLFNSDSREPELAGIWGAVVGSFYTMLVTLALSFPVAILAAIYLEEFAPKNHLTDFIEVNINNLAAVPSIVFGLLGLAVFINAFGLPRSAPLVGGMVLALMTLPTIIIAARASLKAVPPSIREAAIGVGASPLQTVFHHVLPLAMPGILTGTIIGMAQALGETAPLLMIGMVAFVSDIPQGITSPAAALPVQIFLWADSPERAFVERTSAAIIILLSFLIVMNMLAVLLRRRFERRW